MKGPQSSSHDLKSKNRSVACPLRLAGWGPALDPPGVENTGSHGTEPAGAPVRVMAGETAGVRTRAVAGVADETDAAGVDAVRNLCGDRGFQCAVTCHPCQRLGAADKLNHDLDRQAGLQLRSGSNPEVSFTQPHAVTAGPAIFVPGLRPLCAGRPPPPSCAATFRRPSCAGRSVC